MNNKTELKLCIHCKHCGINYSRHKGACWHVQHIPCLRESKKTINLVNGWVEESNLLSCYTERTNNIYCGEEGKYFEPFVGSGNGEWDGDAMGG